MDSSTSQQSAYASGAPRIPVHAYQDPTTRILWVLPANTPLGRQYTLLTEKSEQWALMIQHGRNTGRGPVSEPGPKSDEHLSEEFRAHVADMREKGHMARRCENGKLVGVQEARQKFLEANEAALKEAAEKERQESSV